MLLKVVFDKTAFVKFKISNNFKQNIDETHSKQPKIHRKISHQSMNYKNVKKKIRNQESQDYLKIFVISKKQTVP